MAKNNDTITEPDLYGLDGYKPLPRFEHTCCILCKHFKGKEKGTCIAYPLGIPDKFAIRNAYDWPNTHFVVEPDQEGTITFELDKSHGNNL